MMTEPDRQDSHAGEQALLPAGLRDILPPKAAHEAALINRLLDLFAAQGYGRVTPPLVEFESSLFAGPGAGRESGTFRLLDPASHRMMGVRADMTPQLARIASTRLQKAPRPLRLCYAGPVLRVQGDQLRPEREFIQAGVELIGSDTVQADAEVILLAAEALTALGVRDLSIDLATPQLVPAVTQAIGLDATQAAALRAALDHMDLTAVQAEAGQHGALFTGLMQAVGPAGPALAALETVDLPPPAAAERHRLAELVATLLQAVPELRLTIDPVEHRAYAIEAGMGFTLFARGVRGELGRGGRYRVGTDPNEPATGFSLFSDSLCRALPPAEPPQQLYLPWGTDRETGRQLRQEQGWITLAALEPLPEASDKARVIAEALRLGCSHLWWQGCVEALQGTYTNGTTNGTGIGPMPSR